MLPLASGRVWGTGLRGLLAWFCNLPPPPREQPRGHRHADVCTGQLRPDVRWPPQRQAQYQLVTPPFLPNPQAARYGVMRFQNYAPPASQPPPPQPPPISVVTHPGRLHLLPVSRVSLCGAAVSGWDCPPALASGARSPQMGTTRARLETSRQNQSRLGNAGCLMGRWFHPCAPRPVCKRVQWQKTRKNPRVPLGHCLNVYGRPCAALE